MMRVYQFLLQIIYHLKPVLKFIPHEKVKFFFKNEGRIHLSGTITARPLWIHASSGEIEYAKSLIRELKIQYSHVPLLVTHTSISSENAVKKLEVAAWGVSPLDSSIDVKAFIAKWNPRACLIARTDLWPQTLLELHNAEIPIYLFSATFAQGSKKISLLARQLLKTALPLIKKIYFVSSADEKICKTFFPNVRGEIKGDTRYDQVIYRLQEAHNIKLPEAPKILIAGSTWAEDEEIVIPAFEKLKRKNWKFILVPHEVSAHHMVTIRAKLEQTTLKCHFSSQGVNSFSWDHIDVLLVDQVGILASLYSQAHVAFIGGSFRKQVHSVMEALATKSPVIVGPFHENNREAIEFKKLGFVVEVNNVEQMVNATEALKSQVATLAPKLELEIQKRLGVTKKLIEDLKSQGLFEETSKI